MSFTLRLEFTGLHLFVKTKEGTCIVLTPDCRNGGASHHFDGKPADPHAGYFRVDAAALGAFKSLQPPLPAAGTDNPTFEFVHRLAGEEVTFSGLKGGAIGRIDTEPYLPSFDAPMFDDLTVRADLLTARPRELLGRLVLTGGEFQQERGDDTWHVADTFNGANATQKGDFTNTVVWHSVVDDTRVLLSIQDFAGSLKQRLKLIPVPLAALGGQPGVVVKFANLCTRNSMQWNELPTHSTAEDLDFKWMYRLLESTAGGTIEQRIMATGKPLPHPILDDTSTLSDQGCMPAVKSL